MICLVVSWISVSQGQIVETHLCFHLATTLSIGVIGHTYQANATNPFDVQIDTKNAAAGIQPSTEEQFIKT